MERFRNLSERISTNTGDTRCSEIDAHSPKNEENINRQKKLVGAVKFLPYLAIELADSHLIGVFVKDDIEFALESRRPGR